MPADYGGSGSIAAAAAAAAGVHLDAVEEVPVSWPMLSSVAWPMLSWPLPPPQPQAMSLLTLSPLQVRAATPQVHLVHVYIIYNI